MKLVLHNYWRSSASHRVRIGLGLKGLAFEYVAINIIKRDQFSDAYRDKNPMAQVPTLEITEDSGRVIAISQSLPILEYLDERFPGAPLLPKDPYLRARTRMLAEIINSGIQPLQNLAVTKAVKAFGGDEQSLIIAHQPHRLGSPIFVVRTHVLLVRARRLYGWFTAGYLLY